MAAWAGTEQEEQPRSLEVVKCGDVLEESGVGLAGLLELGLDEFGASYGGARTVRPCSVGGRAGLPTQTSEPNEVRLGGSWPAAFHTLVLPVFSCMRVWLSSCSDRRS